jgi:hypothetical protein
MNWIQLWVKLNFGKKHYNIKERFMKNLLPLVMVLFVLIACKEKDIQTPKDTSSPEIIKESTNTIKSCSKEAKICPDGNSVSRNINNNCEFDPCPTNVVEKPIKKKPSMCTADAKECADGSFVGRDHYNNCKFKDCPKGEKTKKKM